jgi:hypothetical protein
MKHDKQKLIETLKTRKGFFLEGESKADEAEQKRLDGIKKAIESNRRGFEIIYKDLQVQMRKSNKDWKKISDLVSKIRSGVLTPSDHQVVTGHVVGRYDRKQSEIVQELIDLLDASPDTTITSTEMQQLGVYNWL